MSAMRLLRLLLIPALLLPPSARGASNRDQSVGKDTEYPLPAGPIEGKGVAEASGTILSRIVCQYGTPPPPPPPAPKVPEKEVSESKRRDMPDSVYTLHFAKLFSLMDSGTLKRLGEHLAALSAKGTIENVHFVGHTDSDKIVGRGLKKFRDNYELSRARARAVAELFSKQYPKIHTTFGGHGPDEPVATNATREGKAKNRRTEMRVYFAKKEAARGLASEAPAGDCDGKPCPPPTSPPADPPFRVTIDGKPVPEGTKLDRVTPDHVDFQRCTDVALENADIQVRFDGLTAKKVLNLTLSQDLIYAEEAVYARIYSNYRELLKRAELRIFRKNQSLRSDPVSIVPFEMQADGFVDLKLAPNVSHDEALELVLRVYDEEGHFDETLPKSLVARSGPRGEPKAPEADRGWGGWGENYLSVSNIKVFGGTITVSGVNVPRTHRVRVMGMDIPVDPEGKFAAQQVLPSGKSYGIDVQVVNAKGEGLEFRRDLHVPKSDWFLVGIADLIVGGNRATGPASLVTQDVNHYDRKVFVDGRLAFYLKGKIKGEYLMTASADTREGPVGRIFSNFLDKDPAELFRRLDPDRYYPVYGDDSTLVQDAPTQGKFYVKIERDSSHLMWGNFRSRLTDTELAQVDRGLYGLNLRLESAKNQARGERSSTLDVFAATPGTLQAREEFRGTGSTHVWLSHRDLSVGSERVRVEVRDRDSGLVLSAHVLNPQEDYTMNYLQGHVLLRSPLPATEDDSQLVHTGSFSGNPVFVVVRYEYTPGFTEPGSMAYGGRATQWLGNVMKLGVTAAKQNEPGRNQTTLGVDGLLRLGGRSSIKAEAAQTEGPGTEELNSVDGGYTFLPIPRSASGVKARAFRVDTALGLYDLESKGGNLRAYVKQKQGGFNSPGENTPYQTEMMGGSAELPFSSAFILNLKHDQKRESGWMRFLQTSGDFELWLSRLLFVQAGLRHDERYDLSGGRAGTTTVYDFGLRDDVAGKVGLVSGERWSVYGFGQTTLRKSPTRFRNDRAGGGGSLRLTDTITAGGEISGGNLGLGAKAETKYKVDEHHDVYLSYLLNADRSDVGYRQRSGSIGNLVSGTRGRYDDSTSVYYENRYLHGNQPSGLAHSFGVDLSPLRRWTFGFSVEKGTLVAVDGSTQTERTAGTVSVGYGTGDTKAGTSLEARREATGSAVRNTYLTRNTFSSKLDPSWRLLGKLSLLRSRSSQGDFYDGDWTEGMLGLAFRPVTHDRLNLLFKYGFFELLPSPGQIDVNGSTPDFKQRTHILSVDGLYDLGRYFSLGAKYAFASGELRDNRAGGPWFRSDRHLLIGRLDFHVVRGWDALVEWRTLRLIQAQDTRSGALIGLYRHLTNEGTLKIGVGFNFTDYSDNLTDLSFSSRGWFINAVGGL